MVAVSDFAAVNAHVNILAGLGVAPPLLVLFVDRLTVNRQDIQAILGIRARNQLFLIERAAQILLIRLNGKFLGRSIAVGNLNGDGLAGLGGAACQSGKQHDNCKQCGKNSSVFHNWLFPFLFSAGQSKRGLTNSL